MLLILDLSLLVLSIILQVNGKNPESAFDSSSLTCNFTTTIAIPHNNQFTYYNGI